MPGGLAPALMFGWDDVPGSVVTLSTSEGVLAPTLLLTLLARDYTYPEPRPEDWCYLSYSVDVQVSVPGEGQAARLVLTILGGEPHPENACPGWDLSLLGDDPSALGWRFEVRDQLYPDWSSHFDRYLGGHATGPDLFGSSEMVITMGHEVDEDFAVVEDGDMPVPLDREQMLEGMILRDGLYIVRGVEVVWLKP